MIELRDYQIDLKRRIYHEYNNGIRSLIAVLPTGAGKTALASSILKDCADKNKSTLFIVHRRELIKQTCKALDNIDTKYGVVAATFPSEPQYSIQVASIQTLVNRKTSEPRLIVFDECHHMAAETYTRVYDSYPNSLILGLTATPTRRDGQGLHRYFQKILEGPTIDQLTNGGYLCPYKYYAPKTEIDLSQVSISMGDYDQNELAKAIDKPKITGDVVENYMKYSLGKRAIVFAVNIEHSNHIIESFRQAGIVAAHLDGATSMRERDETINRFSKGEIQVLSNVGLFSEGFDVPGIEAVIMVRPTYSLSLHLQMVGRGLRPSLNKPHAIIIDHVENYKRHGLPSDTREWSLHSQRKRLRKGDEQVVPIKRCDHCFTVNPIISLICINCQEPFPVKEKTAREILAEQGDLVEIDQKKKMRMEVGRARTIGDLQRIAQERGYKPGWVWKQLQIKKLI